MTDMNRRLVLVGGAAAAGTAAVPTWASASTAAPKIKDPFRLGVASGDPLPDSVVLWTRLAPAPLNPDGFGGMPDAAYGVEWEIAKDSQFSSVVQRGKVTTTRAKAHSVHAEPAGLQPGTEYFYRFKVDGHISPVGRTRTAPALGAPVAQLKFAIASGQQWEDGWYHAYRGIADDQPDLVLFLSDYVSTQSAGHTSVRENAFAAGGSALAMNRGRYAQAKTDANLQAAHAAAPWVFVGSTDSQAFYEHMPIRSGANSYRQFVWGNLARFHILDTQRYRDDKTLLGATQEQWLLQSLETHPSTWDFLAQQVFFASRDDDGVASSVEYPDSWNGYAAARRRLTQGWVDRKVPNPVVLTGDTHKHWAADLRADYFDHSAPVVGSELVTSSITSNPGPGGPPSFDWFSRNPHVKYHRNQRGYVRVTATAQQAQADFVVVSDAVEKDAAKVALSADVRFVLQAGRPGLRQI